MDSNHSFLTVSRLDRYQALKVCTPIGSSFQSLSSRTHADRPPPTLHCIGWQIAHTDGKCFLPCKLPSTTNRSRHSVRSNESDDPSEDWGIILTSCRLEVDYTLLFSPCRLLFFFRFFPSLFVLSLPIYATLMSPLFLPPPIPFRCTRLGLLKAKSRRRKRP